MGQGNKTIRNHAMPFVANPPELGAITTYGYNMLAFPAFFTGLKPIIALPMTRPEKGDIVEAYLYVEMTAPSDIDLNVRLAIGTFEELAGSPTPEPTVDYKQNYINEQHRKITGSDSKLTATAGNTLVIDADLTRSLHKRGDDEFNSDLFCVVFVFDELPSGANGYSLDKFKLSCTTQIGLKG